jgi:bacteriorhodopsin
VVLGPILLLGASAAIVLGAATRLGGWRWLVFAGCALAAVIAAVVGRARPSSRVFFVATVLVALADLALFALSGARLV